MRFSCLHLLIALAGLLLIADDQAYARQQAAPRREAASMPAFAPIEDDPALPRVLLIGDSISVGYTLAVREALAGKANVHRPAANCGNTTKGLQYLSQWLGDGQWDVIHFNWGLHDLTSIDDKPEVPINEYEKNLRELVARLKKTGATLLWCSTTPVPPGRRAPLKPEDVVRYNEAARKIMDENSIAIDDLYAFALPRLKEIQLPANVHVTPEGSKALARQVAASIEAALKQRPAEKVKALAAMGPAGQPGQSIPTPRTAQAKALAGPLDKAAARIAAKKAARVSNAEAGTSPTLENVAYGDHEKHRIDLWFAKSDKPAPLLAFFHGGGGDKTMYRGNRLLEFCLQNGISCAAVNYRENNQWPFPIPMNDAARAIQFLRHHAAEYHIDPKRIATWGTSLGANVTTWLGYHDDLAKPNSQDPVERESTRLLFVVTSAGQTFNDMQLFHDRVYPYNIIGGAKGGAGEMGDRTKARELSAIYHVTKDDPPIFMTYGIPLRALPLPKDTPRGELIHNPAFGLLFKEKLDELGIENYLYHGGSKPPENAERDFILKHFFPGGRAPASG